MEQKGEKERKIHSRNTRNKQKRPGLETQVRAVRERARQGVNVLASAAQRDVVSRERKPGMNWRRCCGTKLDPVMLDRRGADVKPRSGVGVARECA